MSLLGGSGLTGDIWSTGAFSFESPLKDLLDSKNYTLEQLLAEDELLQELRGLHPVLTEYFGTEKALTKLVRYIILPPSPPSDSGDTSVETNHEGTGATEEGDSVAVTEENGSKTKTTAAQRLNRQLEKRKTGEAKKSPELDPEFCRIRFPYMACEIICCELDGIINTLVDGFVPQDELEGEGTQDNNNSKESDPDEEAKSSPNALSDTRILDVFFSVLYDTPPGQLDDYRAGYFEKILSLLFRKRKVEMSNYINSGGGRGPQTLMEAMMKHLYSNSVMQILQRLLLPPRPTPRQEGEDQQGVDSPNNDGNGTGSKEEDDADDGAVIGGGQDILPGEDEDGESEFKCDWPKTPGLAIDLLLQRLIDPDPLLLNHDGSSPQILRPLSAVETDQSVEEQRLNMSLNASEVLITVIQNSMLSSETMLYLTSFETMNRLVAAATSLRDDNDFQPHESLLTSAMNVVESLVLQLGGYGTVGTMAVIEPTESQGQETNRTLDSSTPVPSADEKSPDDDEVANIGSLSLSKSESDATQQSNNENKNLIADITSLIQVLPGLLDGFSKLLRHPATESWTSPLQFSKGDPVQLLGTPRLRIVRVLESLVLLGDPLVDRKLVQSDCLAICLELFWNFQWCSMLHQSVANLLVHVFEGQNARLEIQEYFICKCNLIGRLMDSFVEEVHVSPEEGIQTGPVMGLGSESNNDTAESKEESPDTEPTGSSDVLPVSEDDIDAAMEKQEDEEKVSVGDEERKGDTASDDADSDEAVTNQGTSDMPTTAADLPTPAQSFRYGYMGHVIIVSQALVQACAGSQWAASQGGEEMSPLQQQENADHAEGMGYNEPFIIADLVNSHELSERWQSFVVTTLATEITVQSTPLGGMNPQAPDMMQGARPELAGRRPGLADDGDIGDADGATAPLPPRGMITANEANDIDERDLEVAASMMAGLNFGRQPEDNESVNSGDSERSYNSGETAHTAGYLFDDPLGQAGSSLGIELGKLTQYRPGGKQGESPPGNPDDSDDEEDDGDDGGNSSSDEEETPDDNKDSDVPVMDLFAGNFNYSQGENETTDGSTMNTGGNEPAEAFDFANFDNAAFDGSNENAFGEFTSASFPPTTEDNTAEGTTAEGTTTSSNADDIFGSGSNSSLLDDLEEASSEPPATESAEKQDDKDDVSEEKQLMETKEENPNTKPHPEATAQSQPEAQPMNDTAPNAEDASGEGQSAQPGTGGDVTQEQKSIEDVQPLDPLTIGNENDQEEATNVQATSEVESTGTAAGASETEMGDDDTNSKTGVFVSL